MADTDHPDPSSHPSDDVSVRGVLWFAGGLVVLLVVAYFVVIGMVNYLAKHDAGRRSAFPPAVTEREVPPQPRLEGIKPISPPPDLDSTGYGWMDKQQGIVRIPIEAAMTRIVNEQRLPVQPGAERRAWSPPPARPSAAASGRAIQEGQP